MKKFVFRKFEVENSFWDCNLLAMFDVKINRILEIMLPYSQITQHFSLIS